MTVSDGLTPTFSWSPQCLATGLRVVRIDTNPPEEIWDVRRETLTAHIRAPEHFGITPPGMTVTVAAKPLVAGAKYVVQLYGERGEVAAYVSFTR